MVWFLVVRARFFLWFSLLLWKVFYIYFFVCPSTQTYSWHGPHVVVRGQLSWVCSPFSSCESWELNSDCWAWQQTPFLVELPCQPILFNWVRDVDGGMIFVCMHMYVYIFMRLYIVCVYFIRGHCMYIIYVYCIVLAVEPEQRPWAIWKQRGTADFQWSFTYKNTANCLWLKALGFWPQIEVIAQWMASFPPCWLLLCVSVLSGHLGPLLAAGPSGNDKYIQGCSFSYDSTEWSRSPLIWTKWFLCFHRLNKPGMNSTFDLIFLLQK